MQPEEVKRLYLAAARYGVVYGCGSVVGTYLWTHSKLALLTVGAVGFLVAIVGIGAGAGNTFGASVIDGASTAAEQDPDFVASGNTPAELKLLLFAFGNMGSVAVVFAFAG